MWCLESHQLSLKEGTLLLINILSAYICPQMSKYVFLWKPEWLRGIYHLQQEDTVLLKDRNRLKEGKYCPVVSQH